MRRGIGFILEDFFPSQLNFYVINTVNYLSQDFNEYDCVLFYEDLTPTSVLPSCAKMSIAEAYHFTGLLIATNLRQCQRLAKMASAAKKVFYAHELEWKHGNKNFIENVITYNDPKIDLWTRSESYRQELMWYSRRTNIAVVDDTNLLQLVKHYDK